MKLLKYFPAFIFLSTISISQDFEYIRYYKNEKDYKSDTRINLINASETSHIQALYIKNKLLSKISFNDNQEEIYREIYDYNEDNSLFRTIFYKKLDNLEKMTIFGDEKISEFFFNYAFKKFNNEDFSNRITNYYFNDKKNIKSYEFLSSDRTKLGEIIFDYYEEGYIKSERWINSISDKTVRIFDYKLNKNSSSYFLTELDSNSRIISKVGINLLLLKKEYDHTINKQNKNNYLPESSFVINDIIKKKLNGWDPKISIFFMKSDLIIMNNNDTLFVDLIKVGDNFLTFSEIESNEVLTLNINTVKEVMLKSREILYPKLEY